eukprot:Filipodium_phascolosomae@DN3577_c0_g1_i1.p1
MDTHIVEEDEEMDATDHSKCLQRLCSTFAGTTSTVASAHSSTPQDLQDVVEADGGAEEPADCWECMVCLLSFNTRVNQQVILSCGHSSICRQCAFYLFQKTPPALLTSQEEPDTNISDHPAVSNGGLQPSTNPPPTTIGITISPNRDAPDVTNVEGTSNSSTSPTNSEPRPIQVTQDPVPIAPATSDVRSSVQIADQRRQEVAAILGPEKWGAGPLGVSCPLCREHSSWVYLVVAVALPLQSKFFEAKLASAAVGVNRPPSLTELGIRAAEITLSSHANQCHLGRLLDGALQGLLDFQKMMLTRGAGKSHAEVVPEGTNGKWVLAIEI